MKRVSPFTALLSRASMLRRLRASFELEHLRAFAEAQPEDEAIFEGHARQLTSHYALLGSSFMIAAILLWWPVDWLVEPDRHYLEAFRFLRTRGLLLQGATLALFLASRRARAASLLVGPILYAAMLACIGYSLGRTGATGLPWLADAMLGLVPFALAPLRLGPRIVATSLVGLTLPASFFLPFPETWRAPLAPSQVSFAVFSIAATVALGDLLHRVMRRSFFQRLALDRARAGLCALNGSLVSRVAEQTSELRALAGHLGSVQEAERRRLSRDLHDQLGQELTAMRYTLGRLEERHEKQPRSLGGLIADLEVLLDSATATVRSFLSELRPRVLEDLGLVAAAEWLCERARVTGQIDCRLTVAASAAELERRLEPEISLVVFRVLQETTTNALRHARASAIEVSLRASGAALELVVKDDGAGFDPRAASERFGLLGLRERVRAAGGRLLVESAPGRGTRVSLTLPVRHFEPQREGLGGQERAA